MHQATARGAADRRQSAIGGDCGEAGPLNQIPLTVAKLPLAKDIDDFDFAGTPVNEPLIRDLANATFVADQRNAVPIGGTGTGKSYLAIAITRALIRSGSHGRFYNVLDLVNRLETGHRNGKQAASPIT